MELRGVISLYRDNRAIRSCTSGVNGTYLYLKYLTFSDAITTGIPITSLFLPGLMAEVARKVESYVDLYCDIYANIKVLDVPDTNQVARTL